MSQSDPLPSYIVQVSDIADAEVDKIYFWYAGRNPNFADRWYDGLLKSYDSLEQMPQRCSVAPENIMYRDVIVLQHQYRQGSTVYRILFHIVEPIEQEQSGVVRILHVRHGAQQWLTEGSEEGEDN